MQIHHMVRLLSDLTIEYAIMIFYFICYKDSDLWSQFARSNNCDENFPTSISKRVSAFQQLLLIQAARPDRLQSAMSSFACRELGNLKLS